MQRSRRGFLRLAAGAAALPAVSRFASAQSYPNRPVRLIIGYTPGGSADLTARLIAQWLSERLGQQFVVESRPGAGTNLATEAVVHSAADGHTLLMLSSSHAFNPSLYGRLNYNFTRDIAPVASITQVPSVMEINPLIPIKTVPEFIAYAKANPGKINMASAGAGASSHIFGELFKMMAGVDLLPVHYRGSGPALTELIGGQVQVMFDPLPSSIEHIRAGRLRPLAVTSMQRVEVLSEIPTVNDFMPGYEAVQWYAIGLRKSTPVEITERLNREINGVLAIPNIKLRLTDMGVTAMTGSSTELGAFVAQETQKWGKVIRAANIKAE